MLDDKQDQAACLHNKMTKGNKNDQITHDKQIIFLITCLNKQVSPVQDIGHFFCCCCDCHGHKCLILARHFICTHVRGT